MPFGLCFDALSAAVTKPPGIVRGKLPNTGRKIIGLRRYVGEHINCAHKAEN